MSRPNKTEFVILGLLSMEPMSGYDMKAFISRPLGYFWAASYGQLYPTLKKLLEGGFVSKKIQPGKGKPARNLYKLTQKGKSKLINWIESNTDPETIRNEILLKLFFGNVVEQPILSDHLKKYQDQQEKRLKNFDKIEKETLDSTKNDPSYLLWSSTLRYGIHISKARIQWCKETLVLINKNTKKIT